MNLDFFLQNQGGYLMLKFTIKPYDVLFFGSGKPFNVGGDAESIFPPFPHSFASAIYAKLLSETGIKILEEQGIYKAVYGPFLKKDETILFPTPLDIMKEKKKEKGNIIKARIIKRDEFKLLNLYDTDLPHCLEGILWVKSDKEDNDYEPFGDYITLSGLKKWLRGQEIEADDLISAEEIYQKEDRISIHLDEETKSVRKEDGLYRVAFVRLKENINFVFYVEANFDEGLPLKINGIDNENQLKEIFEKGPKVIKLGGEARSASYEVEIDDFKALFDNEKLEKREEYKILFLTPAVFEDNQNKDYKNIPNILDSIEKMELISACLNSYVLDSICSKYNKKYSNKTIRAIKPGSFLCVRGYQGDSRIDFFKKNEYFIGSNLVLIKEM